MGNFLIVLPVINDYTRAGFQAFIAEVGEFFAMFPDWVQKLFFALFGCWTVVQTIRIIGRII